jgi:F0F1-type ATP synthase membrane subunit b/b'
MFLKQDLQLTASDLNKYMQEQIKKVLKEEFSKYEESIDNAKQIAVDAINKTQKALDDQRTALQAQIEQEAIKEKARLMSQFEDNMSQVVNHYLLEAIGNEIDLSDQLDYIYRHLEDNKQAILEDIRSGSA